MNKTVPQGLGILKRGVCKRMGLAKEVKPITIFKQT